MTSITPSSLLPFHSGPRISDSNNWKSVPASAVIPMTAEIKARLADAHKTTEEGLQRPSACSSGLEGDSAGTSNQWVLVNVAQIDDDQISGRISYITNLIHSGEAENYSFFSGNGDETTTSIHQYLYWLQLRAKDMESEGTYSPEMFK